MFTFNWLAKLGQCQAEQQAATPPQLESASLMSNIDGAAQFWDAEAKAGKGDGNHGYLSVFLPRLPHEGLRAVHHPATHRSGRGEGGQRFGVETSLNEGTAARTTHAAQGRSR